MDAFSWIDAAAGVVVADGKRLEANAYGPPPGSTPTVVMLHEGLGCVALWRDFPEKLAAATGLGVFVYSRAGYGRSDPVDLPRPLDYMTREARFILPMILDAIGFQRGILFGHSDGASIAAIYHAHVDCAFLGWNGAWLDPLFKAWNIEDFVDRWRVPALLIQGADDQYGTIAQVRAIEARTPQPVASLILEDCRHSAHIEQPQATLDAAVKFCAQIFGEAR